MSGETGAQRPRKHKKRRKQTDYSKQMIADIRSLLWVVTVGGLLLAAYCIRTGYTGALPWLTAMVGLPWSAQTMMTADVDMDTMFTARQIPQLSSKYMD